MNPYKSVLSSMILDNECIPEVAEILTPEMFITPSEGDKLALIYSAIVSLHDAGKVADITTIPHELGNKWKNIGARYLAEIPNLEVSSAAVQHHAEIVLERFRIAQIRNLGDDVTRIANQELNASEMATEVDKAVRKRTESDTPEEESIGDIAKHVEFGKTTDGLITGFSAIDDVIVRIQPTDYVVIAGRPGMGKTSLMTNIAANLACINGIPISFYSCEMSPNQIVRRMCSAISGVPLYRVESPNGFPLPDDEDNLYAAAKQLSTCPMYIKSSGGITPSKLKRQVSADIRKYGVKMVFVDHLHLMKPDKGNSSGYENLTNISRAVKQVILETGVPFIMGCQLKRTEEAKEPSLMDIRGTGAIEEDADVVIGIHRDGYWEDEDDGNAKLLTLKGRHFGTGMGECDFNGQLTSFFNKS